MMAEAEFFDGKSAKGRLVTVRVLGDFLVVDDLSAKEQLSFRSGEFDVRKDGNQVHLSMDGVLIVMDEDSFRQLRFKKKSGLEDLKTVFLLAGAFVSVLLAVYAGRKEIVHLAIKMLPESFLAGTAASLKESLKTQHCLSAEQERVLEAIFYRLGESKDEYDVYAIRSPVPNAFALPGNVIVFHDQLFRELDSPEALAGILAHEMAHVQKKHAEAVFIKTIMFDSLLGITLSQAGVPDFLKDMAKGLFTQEEEQEADEVAAVKLRESAIDPKGVINFFTKMDKKDPEFLKALATTHPGLASRVKTFSEVTYASRPLVLPVSWEVLKKGCSP